MSAAAHRSGKHDVKVVNPAAAVASGLLMAFSLPLVVPLFSRNELFASGYLEPLALLALVPLLVVLRKAGPRRAFGLGALAGGVYFLVSLYWLEVAMTTFGHMSRLLSLPVLFLLVGFLSLFWACACWAAVRIKERLGVGLHLALPVVWVGLEFLRNYVLTGFPWAGLGTTQARSLWLAQLASVGGVYLVAFAVVYTNGVVEALWAWCRRRAALPRWSVAGWAALLAFTGIFSAVRLGSDPVAEGSRLKVAVIQGNLDEKAHLRGTAAQRWVLKRMLEQSRLAKERGAEIVVWPEGTLPAAVPSRGLGHFLAGRVSEAESELPSEMIIGGITRQYKAGRLWLTNSAFLMDSKLSLKARYDKRHLVPFGEYVPLASILPYQWFIPAGVAFFTPGSDHAPLEAGAGKLGVLICYEAIFPEIARQTVSVGAQLLVNITNDSWYGFSSAPYQHLAISRMRAIETGRWLVRAANTGVSAVIDPHGRVVAHISLGLAVTDADSISYRELPPARHLVRDVALIDGLTIYCIIGDLFAWLCSLLAVVMLVATFTMKRI